MRERIGEQREREEEASEFQSEACKGKKERKRRFGFVRVSLPKRPSFRLGQKVQNGVILYCVLKL